MTRAEFDKELFDEITRYVKIYAYTYCKEAEKELTKTAEYAIDKFYNEYTPKYYDRTYDFRNNSVVPYFHDNGRKFYGGVKISGENMRPYQEGTKSETDPFEVVEFATHGWHGHPIRNIYYSPTISEIIEEKVNDQKFHNDLNKKAKKVANAQSYNIFGKFLK